MEVGLDSSIIIYIIICFINVISGTVKTILTVKASPFIAGVVNAISCTINAVVIKFTSDQSLDVIIIVSIISNLIGVYGAKKLIDLFTKDKLWVYNCTIKTSRNKIERLRDLMKDTHGIHSTWDTIVDNEMYSMQFFVYTKKQSRALKEELKFFSAKYYIVEPR